MRASIFALICSLPLLGGCVRPSLADRQAYMGQFVGQPEQDLIRQVGVPARVVESGGHRFLAYVDQVTEILPATAFGPYGPPWAYGGGMPAQVVEHVCETTFEIADGKVLGFSLRGNACGY